MLITSRRRVYISIYVEDFWSDTIPTSSWEHDHVYSERQMEVIVN